VQMLAHHQHIMAVMAVLELLFMDLVLQEVVVELGQQAHRELLLMAVVMQ